MNTIAKLGPDKIKKNLMRAALFVLGFEMLRDLIVDNVKGWHLFNEEEYRTKIGNKNVFEKSCNWLVENGAITSTQAADLQVLRKKRDAVVHEMLGFLVDPDRNLISSDVEKLGLYIATVSKWWGKLHAECDPAFDDLQISKDDVTSPISDLFQYILALAREFEGHND